MHKLLSSTFLGGALVFAAMTGIDNNAAANTFRDLSPNSSWAVSKIENTNARPYCALARRFTNDIVLTFARNKREETSIAIDFQKPRLSNNQYYNVTINAGDNQQREFNIKPVSDRALVLKIGSDQGFMKALTSGGEMKADIEGHVYAFKISEFADGENKMNGCLASLVQPAAGGAFDEPIRPHNVSSNALTPTPVADTRTLLSAEPQDNNFVSKVTESEAELAREVDQLQDENKRLRMALETERRAFEDSYMAQSEDSSAVIELSEKVQLLEVENNELRRKLSSAAVSQKQKDDTASVSAAQCEANREQDSAMARELQLLRGEKETLQLQLKKAEARAVKATNSAEKTDMAETAMMQDLNDRITFLEQENRTLKAQLNEAAAMQTAASAGGTSGKAAMQNNAASVENLQQRVDKLLAENTRLSKTIENMDTGSTGGTAADSFLVSKVKTLETNLQNVKRERNSLLEKIDAMNRSREDGLIDISSGNWDLEQATRRYNEAEREIQRLGLELEQQRSRCNAEKKEIEYMLFDPAIAGREQIARLTEAEERATKAETLLKAQEVRYDDQIAMLEDRTKALKQANAEMEQAQIESIAAKELEQKNAMLLANLNEARDKIEQLKTERQQIATAGADVKQIEREKEFLMQKTAQLEKDNVVLSRNIRETEERLAALQEQAAKGMSRIETASGVEVAAASREPRMVIGSVPRAVEQIGGDIQREALPVEKAKHNGPLPLSPRSVNNYSDTLASIDKVQTQDDITNKTPVKSSSLRQMTGVSAYLQQAGIETDNGVKETEEGRNFAAYSWETNGLYGSAEQQIIGSGQTFDDMVLGYLASTEDRCAGDFASVEASDETISGMRVSSYEIACIADGMSASASVVFIEEDGQFTTIAHEAGIDYMDYAMDMRDKLINSFEPVEMASN